MSAPHSVLSLRGKSPMGGDADARKSGGRDISDRRRFLSGAAERPHPPMEPLGRDGFAERFTGSSRTLWCIAAAILGDRHLAEDALQEAAVIALRKLDAIDPAAFDQGGVAAPPRPTGRAGLPATGTCVTGTGDLPAAQTDFDDRV